MRSGRAGSTTAPAASSDPSGLGGRQVAAPATHLHAEMTRSNRQLVRLPVECLRRKTDDVLVMELLDDLRKRLAQVVFRAYEEMPAAAVLGELSHVVMQSVLFEANRIDHEAAALGLVAHAPAASRHHETRVLAVREEQYHATSGFGFERPHRHFRRVPQRGRAAG